jgi:glycosyltransferase involved in cell wall biosynthesis
MLVWDKYLNKRVEVLNNWQTIRKDVGCSINLSSLTLANKKVLAYTGNVGIAQGADIFIDLAKILRSKTEVVFLFVGRGSYFEELKKRAKREKLDNVIFFDQVDPREIPGLLAQCFLGLISLDDRHKSHNIPGKFVTYLNAGIPVLAKVNLDTDLMKIIKEKGVGAAFSDNKPEILAKFVIKILHDNKSYIEMTKRAKILGKEMFSVEKAAIQITKNLTS